MAARNPGSDQLSPVRSRSALLLALAKTKTRSQTRTRAQTPAKPVQFNSSLQVRRQPARKSAALGAARTNSRPFT